VAVAESFLMLILHCAAVARCAAVLHHYSRNPAAGQGLLAPVALGACQTPDFLQAEMPGDGPPIATFQAQARRFVETVVAALGAPAPGATPPQHRNPLPLFPYVNLFDIGCQSCYNRVAYEFGFDGFHAA
jgi:hypothetical protein